MPTVNMGKNNDGVMSSVQSQHSVNPYFHYSIRVANAGVFKNTINRQ
jgi:hypothetical protein